MARAGRALYYAFTIAAAAAIIWVLISWADVLAHQANGDQHAWNCFLLLIKYYYR